MRLRGWIASALLLVATAASAAPEALKVPEMPVAVQYRMQRRVFLNEEADLGTSPTLTIEQTQREYTDKGFLTWRNDPETGIFFGQRDSIGVFEARPEGNYDFRELLTVPGLREGDVAMQQIRHVEIPVGTEPMKATNTTMALHPLGLVAPRLRHLRELLEQDSVPMPRAGLEVVETPKWRFELEYDPEIGVPTEIRQYKRNDGGLVRRTRYEGWQPDPRTRRWVPGRVATRTFRGSESLPLAELVFTNIRDMEAVPQVVKDARGKGREETQP